MKHMKYLLVLILLFPILLFGISWRASVWVNMPTDTFQLVMGIDPLASEGYDDIDIAIPLLPPSGIQAFFALNDPENPYITMLSTDVRPDDGNWHTWILVPYGVENPVDIIWNPLTIPRGEALFGIGISEPHSWNDMYLVSGTTVPAGEKLWIKYNPYGTGENSAPYVTSTSPENGASGVSIYTPITVHLEDDETGINSNSVRMYVEGVDVTSQITMSGGNGVLTVTYLPETPFDGMQDVNVNVLAQDIETNPLSVSYSFHFVTATAPVPVMWEVVLQISSGDETAVPICFGVDESATDSFDAGGIDVPLPVPPFTALYGYFPINDPEFPYILMLTRDIRSSEVDLNIWEVRWGNATEDVRVAWNTLSLPHDWLLEIAIGTHGTMPGDDEWIDMTAIGYITGNVNQVAYIRAKRPIVDNEPPSLAYSIPASGAVGVSTETNLVFALVDTISGVNVSSVQLIVDGVDVTDEIEISMIGDTALVVYDPPTNFMPNYVVNWSISASDNALPPNIANINGYFTTADISGELLWCETLFVNITPDVGVPYNMNLIFGADETATEFFDYGIDLPAPPPFPGRPEIYFAIIDPIWSKLSRDIRNSEADSVRWYAVFRGIADYGEANISWTGENLPDYGVFRWATAPSGEEPTEWNPMIGTGQFITTNDIVFHIMFLRTPEYFCVAGTVILSDLNTPAQGAMVIVEELAETLYTDEGGYYQLCNIPEGIYTFHFSRAEYFPQTQIVEVTTDVRLDSVYLERAYCLSGSVTLAGDGPAVGATISIPELDTSVITSDDGSYQICEIPAGIYTVIAEYPDYFPETIIVNIPTAQTADFILEMIPNYGTIVVITTLEGTTDFSGTNVTLYQDTTEVANMTTGPTGIVRFQNILYGNYLISAEHSGYEPYASSITLDTPSETLYVQLQLIRGRISGLVNTENPLDMSGTAVILDNIDTVFTDEVGAFEFPNVIYGTHTLSCRRNGYVPFDTTITLSTPELFLTIYLKLHIVLGAPQNLVVISGKHNRVSLKWDAPIYENAELLSYVITRSWLTPLGGDTIAILPSWVNCYIDRDVQTGFGNYYWYRVSAIYDRGSSAPTSAAIGYADDNPTDPDVLIYDFDNGAFIADNATTDESLALRNLLESAGIVVNVTSQDATLDEYELLNYKVVIVITGIFDAVNTLIPETSQKKLMDYIGGGGWIWWEGADIGRDYASRFGSLLGFSLANDGRPRPQGNVTTLTGLPGVFFGPYSANYYYRTLADHRLDELTASSPGIAFLFSQNDPAPNVSNVRGVICAPTGNWAHYRSAITSVYYGGVQPTDEIVRWRYIRGIYWYLTGEDIGTIVLEGAKPSSEFFVSVTPNPFNSFAIITLTFPEPLVASIEVTDILGKNITTICDDEFSTGTYQLVWDASNLPSGIYFVNVSTNMGVRSTPVLLVK